jgi:hypothetical protein
MTLQKELQLNTVQFAIVFSLKHVTYKIFQYVIYSKYRATDFVMLLEQTEQSHGAQLLERWFV